MDLSPLQVSRLSVVSLSIHTNPSYVQGEGMQQPSQLTVAATLAEQTGDAPLFRCQLDVSIADNWPEPPPPYLVHARVAGMFRFLDDTSDNIKTMRQIVAHTGVSILYGFARDIILQSTALGERGPILMPLITVSDLAAELLNPPHASHQIRPIDQQSPSRMYVVVGLVRNFNPDPYGEIFVEEVKTVVVCQTPEQARAVARQFFSKHRIGIDEVRVFTVPDFDADPDDVLVNRDTVEAWIEEATLTPDDKVSNGG
jgi:preprotein translocase subunit SecB